MCTVFEVCLGGAVHGGGSAKVKKAVSRFLRTWKSQVGEWLKVPAWRQCLCELSHFVPVPDCRGWHARSQAVAKGMWQSKMAWVWLTLHPLRRGNIMST